MLFVFKCLLVPWLQVPTVVLDKYFGSKVKDVGAAVRRACVWAAFFLIVFLPAHGDTDSAQVVALAGRRLLQSDGSRRVRLHDLCRERVKELAQAGGTEEPEQHSRLLAAYMQDTLVADGTADGPAVKWWAAVAGPAAADAEYLCTWLGWHLCEAKGEAGVLEAAGLLEDFSWMDLKLRATLDVTGLLHDYRRWPSAANAAIGVALTACAHIVRFPTFDKSVWVSALHVQSCLGGGALFIAFSAFRFHGSSAACCVAFAHSAVAIAG